MANSTLTVNITKLASIIGTWVVFGRFIEPENEQDLREHIEAAYRLDFWPIYAAADDWDDLKEWQDQLNAAAEAGEDTSKLFGLAVAKFIADHNGLIGLNEGRKNSIREEKHETARRIDYCPKHGHHHGQDTGDDVIPGDLKSQLEAMGAHVEVHKVASMADIDGLNLPDDMKDQIRDQLQHLRTQH